MHATLCAWQTAQALLLARSPLNAIWKLTFLYSDVVVCLSRSHSPENGRPILLSLLLFSRTLRQQNKAKIVTQGNLIKKADDSVANDDN
jgi:hypothetical protein